MTQARRSLLAEMALRFVDQRETLATAALGYILSGSATARAALCAFLAERGVSLPDDLAYRAEVVDREHQGRPDIVGMRGERRHLILEGKFWAALTDAQPVSYLRSLDPDGCLLVVAPERRLQIVGAELLRRCQRAEMVVNEPAAVMAGGVGLVDGRRLGVTSWRALLGRLHSALADSGDAGRAADIEQLIGLSDLEDSQAFLPVTAADLATPTPQRVRQFMELPLALAHRGHAVGLWPLERVGPGRQLGRETRWCAAGQIQLAIFVDLKRWAEQRMTPLWLEAAVERGAALADLEAEVPPRVFYDGLDGRPTIPLEIKLHVERDALLDDLLDQLQDLNRRIQRCKPTVIVNPPKGR